MIEGDDMQPQFDAQGNATTPIHFVFQLNPERIACMPHMAEFHETPYHPAIMRTNAPEAVACPQCRASRYWRQASKQNKMEGAVRDQ